MASDLAMIVPSNDEQATTQVVDKLESDESELKKLNNDKFAGIEFLELSTVASGGKGKEEELLVAKAEEEVTKVVESVTKVVENVTKSSELVIVEDNEEITTEVPTTTVSEAEDEVENQPTTVETTL
jgi:Skp family chaperone for outer membrane proteins